MRSWSDENWRRIAWSAWIALAIAASVKTIIEPELHTVYTAFSHCCRDWWAGHSLYQDRAFYYSPTFAVLMTPFAIWPDWLGGVFWNFASIGVLVASLRVFFRDVLGATAGLPSSAGRTVGQANRGTREGQFQLLVLIGTVRSVWSGQSNAMLIALILFGAAAAVRGRWHRAAWLFAAPVYIKVWPAVAGALFSALHPKRFAPRWALAVVALGFLPMLTKAPSVVLDTYADWYRCLSQRQASDFRFPGYRDAWTIWEQLGTPNKHGYLALQAAGGLAVLAWLLWQRRRWPSGFGMHPQVAIYTLAGWSAWQLLLGPGTERLTYNIIAPALAWGVVWAYRERQGRAWITATYFTTYVLGIGGMERLLCKAVPAAVALEPIGVLLFAGWLAWHASRHAANAGSESAEDSSAAPVPPAARAA
jgi:hypothetical protein